MAANYVQMEIREIQTSDDPRDLPIIVLGERDGEREFPIYIGHIEARALEEAALFSMAAHEIGFRRPLSHDLILNVIDGLGATLEKILITKLENGTFFGALQLKSPDGNVAEIDSRPSDAMVLAVKRKCPIFVEEKVLAEVERGNPESPE